MKRWYSSFSKRWYERYKHPIVVERLNAKWLLDPQDADDIRFLGWQIFETDQRNFLLTEMKRRNVTRFFDCGARMGIYSVFMAQNMDLPGGIDAFEPIPAQAIKIRTNLWMNNLDDQIRLHEAAVSDSQGEAHLMIPDRFTGTSTLICDQDSKGCTVQTVKLDDLCDERGASLALKIDVEGAEHLVVKGMQRLLKENSCLLQIECFESNKDRLFDLMASAGYSSFSNIEQDYYFEKQS